MSKIYSNVVSEEKTREVQMQTLDIMADTLSKSFGPNGSHTAIVKDNGGVNSVEYTKDGKTIAQNIVFKDPIERTVQDMITELTRYIVKEVGDGTTSAVLLSRNIFKELVNNTAVKDFTSRELMNTFDGIIKKISKKILDQGRECTIDDIYEIAYTSTNGNADIAATIQQIYKKYGMDVYIDIGISNEVDNIIKEYDGMTLDTGFSNTCFINDHTKNVASIRNAKIYAFKDAIDTPEMLNMLDKILSENILKACQPNSMYEMVPTVIICEQKITPDASSYLDSIVRLMNSDMGANIPLLMISQVHQYDLFEDIVMMCGAPFIKKYLNPDIQKEDIDKGLAPTPDTIVNFCGKCELVESGADRTKFINPEKMFNEDRSGYSDIYTSLLNFLETELTKAKQENDGINKIGAIKRRISSLKGNMVDFLVGGITPGDREVLKASVEDAILNCRSTAKFGVGYGANFMALKVLYSTQYKDCDSKEIAIYTILYNAYRNLTAQLYGLSTDEEIIEAIDKSIKEDSPMNLRTGEYDKKVLSSIKSDIAILETINKILMLMFTSNQYLVQSPMHNIYMGDK